jgi:predicted Ser/Thr protein kinase
LVGRRGGVTADGGRKLGRLAVRRGLISEEQLRSALAEWEKAREAGSEVPFGEFLIKKEFITRHHLESLLALQGRQDTGELIPGYEFLKKLGRGGMGTVYLVRQKSLDRLVAVKILPAALSRDREFLNRFYREARMAGKLDHVNIVRGFDVSEHGGHHYFVMEYVPGQPLNSLVRKNRPMAEERALHIAVQVARALDYAHGKGVVHRDIKPGNILVAAGDVAKVCDMGLAKHVQTDDTQLTVTGMTMGSPHYISPEQARGGADADIRSDIYSLGATLYHIVTGQTPFSGTSAAVVITKHLTEEVPWPQDVNPDVSEGCCLLVDDGEESGGQVSDPGRAAGGHGVRDRRGRAVVHAASGRQEYGGKGGRGEAAVEGASEVGRRRHRGGGSGPRGRARHALRREARETGPARPGR